MSARKLPVRKPGVVRIVLSVAPLSLLSIGLMGASSNSSDSNTQASAPRHSASPARTPPRSGRPFRWPTLPSAFVTLQPTTTEDLYDPVDITPPGTGRLSLREAMAVANRLNVETAIVLERGAVYRLERCGPFDAPVDSVNELVHTANQQLTLNGNAATIHQDCDGAGVLVQQGGDRLLNLVDLTISGGRSRHVPGGGVWSSGVGEVRVTNTVIRDNQVSSSVSLPAKAVPAGGVSTLGFVIVSGSTFAENSAVHGAGAIAAAGPVKAVKSSILDNSGAIAGAIVAGDAPSADGGGGGFPGGGGPPGGAGPPSFTGRTPPGLTLIFATLDHNSRPAVSVTGGLTSYASVISAPGAGTLCKITGPGAALGVNYFSGGADCGPPATKDPQLTPVTGMKGVAVRSPAAGSPLRDVIPAAGCVPPAVRVLIPVYTGWGSDELGVPRPQGNGCDIGAIEAFEPGALARHIDRVPVSELPQPPRWSPVEGNDPAVSGTIRVATTEDTLGGAAISLRDAFERANRATTAVSIVLEPHVIYRLTRCEPPQAARDNNSNDLIFSGTVPLHLEGNGSTIVQTCNGSGVLALFTDQRVVLQGMTFTGGRSVIHPGGAIYSAGSGELVFERSWVTDNSTVAAGGGVASFGKLVLLDSTVSDNHSTEVGGGVIGTDDVTAVNSSFFNNIADLAIGAIGNHSGRLTLLFSTIAGNSAPNVAVGSLSAVGSVIADYLPPSFPPGGPPPGGGHGGPPTAAPPPVGPPPGGSPHGGPGGLPPPANCVVEHPAASARNRGNYDTDGSCGFASSGRASGLKPDRAQGALFLIPDGASPLRKLIPAQQCAPWANTFDATGRIRRSGKDCSVGAVQMDGT